MLRSPASRRARRLRVSLTRTARLAKRTRE
jgi:hypothetical protein